MNFKKSIFVITCSILGLALLAGCGKSSKLGKGEKVTISVSDWPRENEPDKMKMYEGFQKTMLEKYNVEVVGDEYQYAVNSFLPKAAGNSLPTLYKTWFTETKKIIENGFAADITEQLKNEGWDKEINPKLLPLISSGKSLYGTIEDGYHQGLVCNIKLFKQAGLVDENGIPKAPKTYDELITVAKTIKEKTGAAGFALDTNNNTGGWHFMNIAWSYGVEFVKNENGKWKATFNSPEAVAALQYVKDLKWKYDVLPENILLDWAGGQEAFATDQAAMLFFNGKFHGGFDFMINTYKISKDNIAIFSLPAGPKDRVALIGGNAWMFAPNATPAQIEAGLKWLEITGYGPIMNDTAVEAEKTNYKTDSEAGYMVGVDGLPAWAGKDRMKIITEIRKDYINVNPLAFADYNNTKQVTFKEEVPVAAQDIYKALDRVIQKVLSDKNADCQKVLDDAVANVQKDVLDTL